MQIQNLYTLLTLGRCPCVMSHTCSVNICRLDAHFVIKIADFGLSEDVYARNYFRQGQGSSVKLPVKWMAPESLQDGIFSDKTDVVSVESLKGGSSGKAIVHLLS